MNNQQYEFVPIGNVVVKQLKKFPAATASRLQRYYFIRSVGSDKFVSTPITNLLIAFSAEYGTLSVKGFGINTGLTLDSPSEDIAAALDKFIATYYKRKSIRTYQNMNRTRAPVLTSALRRRDRRA